MRTSLLPGLLANLAHNLNRQSEGVRLFEVGKVFFSKGGDVQPEENTRMTAVLSGRRHEGAPVFHYGGAETDFFDASGAAEWFLDSMGYAPDPPEADDSLPFAAPAAALRVAGERVGACGRLAAEALRRFGIKQPAWFIDIDLDRLMKVKKKERRFRPLPKFPAVHRDIAVILPGDVPAAALMDAVRRGGGGLLERAEIFDVFTGEGVGPGRKSVAVRLVFRSPDSTLKDRQVNRAVDGILKVISAELGGKLRES
jgi:phenylalanyl-tRNA synthetase beta chain